MLRLHRIIKRLTSKAQLSCFSRQYIKHNGAAGSPSRFGVARWIHIHPLEICSVWIPILFYTFLTLIDILGQWRVVIPATRTESECEWTFGLVVKLNFTLSTHLIPLKITARRSLVRLVSSCLPYVQLPRLMPRCQTERPEQERQNDRFLIFSKVHFRRPYAGCHSFSRVITNP